jgi:diguanylate cyclase (GGDEF)-like protein
MNSYLNQIRVTYSEQKTLLLPALFGILLINIFLVFRVVTSNQLAALQHLSIGYAIIGLLYTTSVIYLIVPLLNRLPWLAIVIVLINSVFMSIALVLDHFVLPNLFMVLVIISLTATAIIAGRPLTYIFLLVSFLSQIIIGSFLSPFSITTFLQDLILPILGVLITETVIRLERASVLQYRRLEMVNNVARNLASSLEIHEVITLLSNSIQRTFEADTYYIGLLNGDLFHLEVLFDEGESFPPDDYEISPKNFTGWVIYHRTSLLIGDSRIEKKKYGIEISLMGKDKPNISWMGTPIITGGILLGLVAVASYKANSFSRADLELLENVAKQAAMAIDNANHHAEVEHQSTLDSMTGASNHSHFLCELSIMAEDIKLKNSTIGLIMLDIDHFKIYNDRYGHLVGDQVLYALTNTIRKHIKVGDAFGRWGGEEFAIALPGAGVEQTLQVAARIRETLKEITLTSREGETIPAPTISQGVAVYPDDTGDVFQLIDLADQALYLAKERGRDQIETYEKSKVLA